MEEEEGGEEGSKARDVRGGDAVGGGAAGEAGAAMVEEGASVASPSRGSSCGASGGGLVR